MIPAPRYQPRLCPADPRTRSTALTTTRDAETLYVDEACVAVGEPPVPVVVQPRPHPGAAGEIPATGFGGAVALLAAVVVLVGFVLWVGGRWSR